MSNFIAEIRPRINQEQTYHPPTFSTDDFVAEIRPRRINHSEFRHENNQCRSDEFSDEYVQNILSAGHFSIEHITHLLRGSILTFVEKLFAGRSLSRVEGHLCVSLSSHELPLIINLDQTYSSSSARYSPIEESLEDSFNVKVRNDFSGACPGACPNNDESFGATSPLFEFEREHCSNAVEADDRTSLKSEYHRNDDSLTQSPALRNCDSLTASSTHTNYDDLTESGTHRIPDSLTTSPTHNSQSTTTHLTAPEPERLAQSHTHCPATTPAPKFENNHRNESDDESGYTSNEKEDPDSPSDHCECSSNRTCYHNLYNEYYCNGFDDKNTLYTPEDLADPVTKSGDYLTHTLRDGTYDIDDDEEDFEFDQRLVIDESSALEIEAKSKNTICSSEISVCNEHGQLMDVDVEESSTVSGVNRDGAQNVYLYTGRAQRCVNVEIEDGDFPNNSDITDTDVPVDFTGDGNFTLDVISGTSQSQSFVSKHHDGFRCMRCTRVLEDVTAVVEHAQTDHDLHCCTVCFRTFTAKNNLKRHLRIHTGQRPYKCTQCSHSFARRDDLKDHTLRHEYTNPFRCSKCKRGYTDRACVKNHMAKEHGSRLMHVCPQCGESYDDEDAFAAHKRTHPELQQFSCNTCSFIGTNNQMIQKHALLHTHKLFACKPCNAYFADPFDYTNHIRKHKKTSSFSQYVCCFCDLTLSTYNQYIRHEYSHAQGKTHCCKTCKKLFKSKSLLQEHITIHQKFEMNEAEITERSPPESPEFNDSSYMFWQSNEAPNCLVYGQSTKSGLQAGSISTVSPPPLKTDSSTSQEEGSHDEFQGQLLDLSMKRSQSPTLDAKHPRDGEKYFDRYLRETGFAHCLRETGFAENNFPRNGVVLSNPRIFEKVHEDNERPFDDAYPRVKTRVRQEERLHSVEGITDSFMNCEWDTSSSDDGTAPPNAARSYLKPLLNAKPGSDQLRRDAQFSPPVKPARRSLGHNTFLEHAQRSSFRFSPYSREKIADLAAKFVAARGTQIFQQRIPPKANASSWENRPEASVPRGIYNQIDQTSNMASLSCKITSSFKNASGFNPNETVVRTLPPNKENVAAPRDLKRGNEIMCEESNPETALRYHAPTLVKSEPIFENVRDNEDAVKGRSHSFRDECAKSKNSCTINVSNSCMSASFGCEECRDVFGSFSELENHSVEVHKRFLCEHCRKSFTARPNRDRHVRYHTGERPYKCDLCDLAFFRGDDLKYHRTTRHHTAQPFVCTSCSASFSWKRDLDRHIRHSKCKT